MNLNTMASLYRTLSKKIEETKNPYSFHILFQKILRAILGVLLFVFQKPQHAFESTAPRTPDGSYIMSYHDYKHLQRKTRYSFASSLIILFFAAITISFYFPNFPGREPKIAFAATYYVATTGNNGNTCLSLETACLTITGALGKVTSGDTINVAAGTYTEDLSLNGSHNNITLNGANKSTTTIKGIIIFNGGTGINAFQIQNFTINANNNPQAISIRDGISGVTITNNNIMGYNSVPASVGAGIEIYRGSNTNTITANTIYGGVYGLHIGSAGTEGNPISNITIKNNTIYSNTVHGIFIDRDPITNLTILNNTISDNGAGPSTGDGIHITVSLNNFTGSIKNNLITFQSSYGINASGGGSATIFSYNNVFGNTLGNYNGLTAPATHISSDPLYTNRTNQNYILLSTSPSIDAGNPADSYSAEPTPNGCRINQGSSGNTTGATISNSVGCVFYVNGGTGSNSNTGRATDVPWKTITYAMGQAQSGNTTTVTVASGTYNAALGELFPLNLVSGLTLTASGGASNTNIVGGNSDTIIFSNNNATLSTTTVNGFTVEAPANNSTAFQIQNGSAGITLSQNIVKGACGTGMAFNPSSGTLSNNIIYNCTTGIAISGASTVTVKNNTLYNNSTELGIIGDTGNVTVQNNIFQHGSASAGSIGINRPGNATLTNTYNNIYNHENNRVNFALGTGEVSIDCKFVDVATANFLLKSDSLCQDAGNTIETDPNGSRIDLGAYGGTASASVLATVTKFFDITPPGTPQHPEISINKECKIVLKWENPKDIDLERILILRGMEENARKLPISANPYAAIARGVNQFVDDDIKTNGTYHYIIRAVDSHGNQTGNEEIQTISTLKPESTNLEITETHTDGFTVSFGEIAKNQFLVLKYFKAPITEENFKDAPAFVLTNDDQQNGQTRITGLSGDTKYYLAAKVGFGECFLSDLSNILSGITSDLTPPGPLENPSVKKKQKTQKSFGIASFGISAIDGEKNGVITLAWVEPSDNGSSTDVRPIQSYLVRYSNTAITEENFFSASEYIYDTNDPLWHPRRPGEIHEVTINNLPRETEYVAIKACDESKNCSALTLFQFSLLPPNPITDLLIIKEKITDTSFTLKFTPFDQEKFPNAFLDIRYKTDGAINDENFESATKYIISGPKTENMNPGEIILSALSPDQTYSLGIKIINENGASKLSNVVSDATLDKTPPEKVENLTVVDISKDEAKISWKEPGDNGGSSDTKSVTSYSVSLNGKKLTISEADSKWKPMSPGGIHTITLSNLSAAQYTFAISACDEVPLCGKESSVTFEISPETPPEELPPSNPPVTPPLPEEKIDTTPPAIAIINNVSFVLNNIPIPGSYDVSMSVLGNNISEPLRELQICYASVKNNEILLSEGGSFGFAPENISPETVWSANFQSTLKNETIRIWTHATDLSGNTSGSPCTKIPESSEGITITWYHQPGGGTETPYAVSYSVDQENTVTETSITSETINEIEKNTGSGSLSEDISKPIISRLVLSDITKESDNRYLATINIEGYKTQKSSFITLHIESDPFEFRIAVPEESSNWNASIRLGFSPGTHTMYAWATDASLKRSENSDTITFTISVTGEGTAFLPNGESKPLEEFIAVLSDTKKTTSTTISSPVIEVLKTTVDNPTLEDVSSNVAPAVLTTIVLANTIASSTGFNILAYLQYLFTSPILLLARRKRKGWGIVYNALSKKPIDLAIVRLYNRKSNKLIQTKVTDHDGRYQFMVPAGQYYITVIKPGFEFPTSFLQSKNKDLEYLDLYHGDTINITGKEGNVSLSIPLDPLEQTKEEVSHLLNKRLLWRGQSIIAYSGILLAFISFVISPIPLILALLVAHVLLYLFFRRLSEKRAPHSWGKIIDEKTEKPIANVVVRIFDTEFHRLLETQLTDREGRYSFLVGNNLYYLTVEKENYQTLTTDQIDLRKKGTEKQINKNVALSPLK